MRAQPLQVLGPRGQTAGGEPEKYGDLTGENGESKNGDLTKKSWVYIMICGG